MFRKNVGKSARDDQMKTNMTLALLSSPDNL
jgi:hypothetical protein